jgi:hypothetical protein
MGSFSFWHWLVVILIVGIFGFFFAAMSRSRVRSFLFARAERRAYARQQTPLDESTPGRIRFRLRHWLIVVLSGAVPIIDIALRGAAAMETSKHVASPQTSKLPAPCRPLRGRDNKPPLDTHRR